MEKNMQQTITNRLRNTGRENIDKVLEYMEDKGFFSAPASVKHHNNFEAGLAKHSLEVLEEALKPNPASRSSGGNRERKFMYIVAYI